MKKKRNKKIWISAAVIGLITSLIIIWGGITMFKLRSQEEIRNRKYEVSLVKALKNSYSGIEEIKITEPDYTPKPGDWSCKVEIVFNDGNISYRIGHYLDDEVNYEGRMEGKTDEEINNIVK